MQVFDVYGQVLSGMDRHGIILDSVWTFEFCRHPGSAHCSLRTIVPWSERSKTHGRLNPRGDGSELNYRDIGAAAYFLRF